MLGWRDVPTDDQRSRPERAWRWSRCSGRSSSGARRARRRRGRRSRATRNSSASSMSIRKRIEHAVDSLGSAASGEAFFYVVSLSSHTLIYKGMLTADQIGADVPGSGRPGDGVGAGAGAPALQHQHLPVVAARPSLPLRRPQRRDQHPARQHQLDEGARGAAALRRARRRPHEASCRSFARAAATRPSSTTCSSSW